MFLAFLVCGPVLVLVELARLVWRHRLRLASPLDGPAHVVLSLAAVALCLFCPSRRPPLVLFTAHSCLLALVLLERLTLRRLRWRSGHSWWCALLIAVEATSLVFENRCFTLLLLLAALRSLQRVAGWENNPPRGLFQGPLWWCTFLVFAEATGICLRELRGPPAGVPRAGLAAGLWFGLLAAAALAANWARCKRHYSVWQRRRATFVLCTDGASADSGGSSRTAVGRGDADDLDDLDNVA
ncbi:unnamed protein product [Prorocentrum cordatum]|uniref:Uncharacterized protein n=1 Tax=Prorocentrum cordatum TaxID=2364126 RepID=A0ABN9RF50_9DINO|nr:unnamed protein product [Polarella glacialis]